MVQFEDFVKLDLRVAKVLEVENHPDADKLYLLKVDIGDRVIQLVAGIKAFYSPEEILDKRIIVIVNLEPRKIRGVESQGMLLAAKDLQRLSLVTLDREVDLGSKVG
ncbi:MAG: methionine--tRNA ligase subunit beta [Candidatus Omnitrophica bacterium]|nr:methionine--tRNA ligase subunit beta [Candidatus Omnitrophota bacterium]